MNQMKKEELETTISDSDRIECAIRHIQTAVDVDSWAVEIAVEAMKTQLPGEGTTSDLISRQEAIDAMGKAQWAKERLMELPSAQPEIKPISYQDCANAMMMMWIDNVLTDGEYTRIMDKLNDHESRRENR